MIANIFLVAEGCGQPASLVRITNRSLVLCAAKAAIREAEARVDRRGGEKTPLGRLALKEVENLRDSLELVIPELKATVGQK